MRLAIRLLFCALALTPAAFAAPTVINNVDQIRSMMEHTPIYFEPNVGQFDRQVRFMARGAKYQAWITDHEMVLAFTHKADTEKPERKRLDPAGAVLSPPQTIEREVIRIHFGDQKPRNAAGLEKKISYSNYLIGNDSRNWHSSVPNYDRVKLEEVYPGIDIVFYGKGRELEYDYIVKPGADPGLISVHFDSPDQPHLDARGNVSIGLRAGQFTHSAPVAFQEDRVLKVGAKLDEGSLKFRVDSFDPTRPLTIDPALQFSTFLGGVGSDQEPGSIALDASGNIYVVGYTASTNFPITAGAFRTTLNGTQDGFVTKFNATATTLLYSTYIGGSSTDTANSIALDASGNAYVLGSTGSSDFPTTAGAFDTSFNGTTDIFVAKLNAAGTGLLYGTFAGGSNNDFPGISAIAIDSSGNAFFTGTASSSDFPVTAGSFDTAHNGGSDAFVAKLNPSGSNLVYSTFLGTAGDENAYAIALDSAGNAYVALHSNGAFPTTAGAFDTTNNGGFDAIAVKLNASGSGLVFSTFLGGSANDFAFAVALDSSGNVFVTGDTQSSNFPVTANGWDSSLNGVSDIFVVELNPTGSTLLYSTFLGGNSTDRAYNLKLDASGQIYLTGYTFSTTFPVTANAFDKTANGGQDAFMAQLSITGGLLYATYIGGSAADEARGLALYPSGDVLIAGTTASSNFPTTVGAFDTGFNGGSQDVFVSRLSIITDTTPPVITPNVSPGPNANGWNNSPLTVSWTVTDPDSTITSQTGCGTTALSTETPVGGTTLTCAATSAGGTSSNSVTVKIDLTKPAITGVATPPANANGWNNTDVNVNFTCSDALSGVNVSAATVPKTTEGAGQSAGFTCNDLAGNVSSLTVSNINIDKTAPTGSATRTPAANANGWNNTDVTANFTCADALSGVVNATASNVLTTEGASQSSSYNCQDKAGNTFSVLVSGINIDKTPPTGTATPTPAANANGWNNTNVTVNFGCADALSGPVSATSSTLLSSEGASQSASYNCQDLAGNSFSALASGINIDKTAPTGTASPTPAANANGWNNTDVTANFTCSDALSGVVNATASSVLSAEGTSQSAGYNCQDNAGNPFSVSLTGINIDKTPPNPSATAAPTSNANGWNNTNVTVTFSGTDNLSGIDSCTSPSTLFGEGASQSASGSCTDRAGNTSATATASGINIDKTPPTPSAAASPAPNANNWNNTNVTVTFTGTDNLSGIANCSNPVTLSSEGTGQSASGSCNDKAGNTSSPATASGINIDKTPPAASAAASPLPNANGWNNTNVTVTFSGTDNLSGIDSCTSPSTLSGEGAGQSASGSCTDKAGNTSAPATASGINIDKTQPVPSAATAPAANANGWNNTNVTVNFSGIDSLSGIGSCTSPSTLTSEGIGQSASGSCTDKAGNTSVPATATGINIDKTSPMLTFGPVPNGWSNTNVSITFTPNDALSGVASANPASSPLVLMAEGSAVTGTVTVTDNAGNSATFTSPAVMIDKTPPTATATPNGTLGNNQWYTSNVVVSLTGNDGSGSGIASCTAPMTLSTDGTGYSGSGTCTDNAGNTSSSASVTGIKIDKTPPTVTFGPAPSGWSNTNASVAFTTSDATSGVASSNPVSSPLVLSSEGSAVTGTVTVTDNAGNSATFTSPAVMIDKTPPTATVTPNGTLGNNQWYTSNVVVSFTGNDGNGSGIANCTAPVTLSSDGTGYSASGTCTDTAGNTSSSSSVTGIKIDKTPPTLTFGPAPSGWSNTNVSIAFTTSDATSGVASSNPVSSPLVLSSEGPAVTGTVTVTDNAGNNATFTSSEVMIDKTPPTATATANGTLGINQWYTTNVVVSFTGNDGNGSGIANCTAPVTLSSDGTGYSASGTCTDTAGNTSSSSSVTGIKIDKTPPTLTFGPAPSGWSNTDVSITFADADATSGVASTNPVSSPLVLTTEGSAITGTVTVTDNAGNTATFTSPAVEIDKTAPTIAPHSNVSAYATTSAGAIVTYTNPSASDSLSSLTLVCMPVSGGTFPVGTTPVACTATDAAGNSASTSFSVIVGQRPTTTSVVLSSPINEGQTTLVTVTVTDTAGGSTPGGTVTLSGPAAVVFATPSCTLTGSGSTASCSVNVTGTNGPSTNTITATYGGSAPHLSSNGSAVLVVNNVAPSVQITGPTVWVYPVNTTVNFTATFTDPGILDTHTAQWTFDAITVTGTVTEPSGSTPGAVTKNYMFANTGVYKVTLTVTDNDGGVGTAQTINSTEVLIAIYDPNGGFVTGGGWINSAPGALTGTTLSGKASFGFVSRYEKGANKATGETEFQFQLGNLNFHSTVYDWLVISGPKAQYKGAGTINGSGNYKFLLTATDGEVNGGGGVDKFRIKITDSLTGAVVYDNVQGGSDDIDLANPQALGGGSIVIHTK